MGFLPGIFKLPGSGAMNSAMGTTSDLMKQQLGWNNQYFAPALQSLMSQYQNPMLNTSQIAAGNQAKGQVKTAYNYASQQTQKAMGQRGLGKSSFAGSAVAGLGNQYGQAVSGIQSQQLAMLNQQQQSSLLALLNAINPGAAGQTAQSLWNMGKQKNDDMMGAIGGLFKGLGSSSLFGGGQAAGAGGATSGTGIDATSGLSDLSGLMMFA